MLGKNNFIEQKALLGNKYRKYILKKTTIGLVSVAVGFGIALSKEEMVGAQEINSEELGLLDENIENESEGKLTENPLTDNDDKIDLSNQPDVTNENTEFEEELVSEKTLNTDDHDTSRQDVEKEIIAKQQLPESNKATVQETNNNADKIDLYNEEIEKNDEETIESFSSDPVENFVELVGENERELLFNNNWKVSSGDEENAERLDYNDINWERRDLPHDSSIYNEFSTNYEAESGFLPGGINWYRKEFSIPESYKNKNIVINFDGAYMDTEVYVNSNKLGTHHHGYTDFAFDITDYLDFEENNSNLIAVRVENALPSSRWYSGTGIYRDVHLIVTDKLHVANHGTKIEAENLEDTYNDKVTTIINTTINNNYDESKIFDLVHELVDADNNIVATSDQETHEIDPYSTINIESSFIIDNPILWSLENPYLYTVNTKVLIDGEVVDLYNTDFGYRYFNFDRDYGFSLNGEKMKLKGVNMHHDQGALGAVANYDAIERQILILKEMGANAIRTAHNPASTALIDLANKHGMLIVEEAFDGWDIYKNGNVNDYARHFTAKIGEDNQILYGEPDMTWAEFDLKQMIRKSQNSPAVIMWSLGNEVAEGIPGGTNTDHFTDILTNLINWTYELDKTRPVTISDNHNRTDLNTIIADSGGIIGKNYKTDDHVRSEYERHSNWIFYMSETASAIHTRGEYSVWDRNLEDLTMSAYDTDEAAVPWGDKASESWRRVIENDFIAGEFVWTGFDYLGEPTPWNGVGVGSVSGQGATPNSSYFGIIDTAGFPKDTFYLYRSMWHDGNTLHIMPQWKESEVKINDDGQVRVDVFTNATRVELYLNGKKIDEAVADVYTTEAGYSYNRYGDNPYPTFFVDFEPGELSARAFDDEGNEITGSSIGLNTIKTYGEVDYMIVSLNRDSLTANGRDLLYIEVDMVDDEGNFVANADNRVSFEVTGNGELVGVDNGHQADLDSYKGDSRKAFNGKVLGIVQATNQAGEITVTIKSDGLEPVIINIPVESLGVTEQTFLRSYDLPLGYYVQEGQELNLPTTVSGRLSNGESVSLNIKWNPFDDTKLNEKGEFIVTGLIEEVNVAVSTTITVIEQIAGVENYSTAIRIGEALVLPNNRPIFGIEGEQLNTTADVVWDTSDVDLDKPGTVVVEGVASVFGSEYPVYATVRVVEGQEYANIAHKDFEDAPKVTNGYIDAEGKLVNLGTEPISDSLNLNNDIYTDGTRTDERWTNYKLRNEDPIVEPYIQFEWEKEHEFINLRLWHFVDSASSVIPGNSNVRFEYYNTEAESWERVEHSNITQASYAQGHTPYGFNNPIRTKGLRIFIKSPEVGQTIGLTGVEIDRYIEPLELSSTAEVETITINGEEVEFNEYNEYEVEIDEAIEIDVVAKDNAAITVIEFPNFNYLIKVVSEDGNESSVFRILNVSTVEDSELEDIPADDKKDDGSTETLDENGESEGDDSTEKTYEDSELTDIPGGDRSSTETLEVSEEELIYTTAGISSSSMATDWKFISSPAASAVPGYTIPERGERLPDTATLTWILGLIGSISLISGSALAVKGRKKK